MTDPSLSVEYSIYATLSSATREGGCQSRPGLLCNRLFIVSYSSNVTFGFNTQSIDPAIIETLISFRTALTAKATHEILSSDPIQSRPSFQIDDFIRMSTEGIRSRGSSAIRGSGGRNGHLRKSLKRERLHSITRHFCVSEVEYSDNVLKTSMRITPCLSNILYLFLGDFIIRKSNERIPHRLWSKYESPSHLVASFRREGYFHCTTSKEKSQLLNTRILQYNHHH